MGKDFQKSALPTLLHFARVGAVLKPLSVIFYSFFNTLGISALPEHPSCSSSLMRHLELHLSTNTENWYVKSDWRWTNSRTDRSKGWNSDVDNLLHKHHYTKKWIKYSHLNPILIPVKSSTYSTNQQKLNFRGITV